MRLPFNLDFKSIVIGAILAYFVIPRILSFVTNLRSGSKATSAN